MNILFFENITFIHIIAFFSVLLILLSLNEIIRFSKWTSLAIFIALPLILTPIWISQPSDVKSWFYWVKVYSALAGSIIFMVIRFTDYHKQHKWYLVLPAFILGLNIFEAVMREFQIVIMDFGSKGVVQGMKYISGDWNYANAIAGLLNILLLCGWSGIFASKGKRKDMIWPDQIRFWIIAYGFWNTAYVYSCSPLNSFYSGFALNIAATIPAMFWAKGAWLQHRAATLSFWMMWVMTFPTFFAQGSIFNAQLTYDPMANRLLAYTSLALNVSLAVWQIYRIIKNKLNPLKDEIYTDLAEYKYVASFKESK